MTSERLVRKIEAMPADERRKVVDFIAFIGLRVRQKRMPPSRTHAHAVPTGQTRCCHVRRAAFHTHGSPSRTSRQQAAHGPSVSRV